MTRTISLKFHLSASPRMISFPHVKPHSSLSLPEEYKDMQIFMATLVGSATGLSSLSQLFFTATAAAVATTDVSLTSASVFARLGRNISCPIRRPLLCTAASENSAAGVLQDASPSLDSVARQSRRSADWKTARDYNASGFIYEGRVEGYNSGGLLVRFRSLVGFLPFPQLSPSHSCKESQKTIQETAKGLTGSLISFKIIQADEEKRNLIFSEKEAVWAKFSRKINAGDIFVGRVGSVEDYGAFIHLQFPDGLYHLTGLVHVSEVSWDLIQDIRDFLAEGDEVRVKVMNVDREKSRIGLSIRQLEEDPLLETLDKVIPQDGAAGLDSLGMSNTIEPLPGLDSILQELLQEDGVDAVRINRQGFEKRVVSQDLQLWLSNAPPLDNKFTLLARAGRQVQEIQLTTSLDQEGIKKALQRVLERVP